ncbi:uncharacterized protein LOC114518309 [Dendronephthya gigantea]|uniref:uncharacterized protein LOC114518309 n=1 Tax=Dendronephthya gigantea TaxID=151771 RepID=UPI00106DC196|nr:uncharacterized protein LOC114518309 [Dendronephthya gigantea]
MYDSHCSQLKRVEVHHKKYFDYYLAKRQSSYTGMFYNMINHGIHACCNNTPVQFTPIEDEERSIEEILSNKVKANRDSGVLNLYFPEFADKTTMDVYDATTPFIRLSRSPGHAIVMVKPDPKEPVFIGEIIVKSWAILIFLVAFAWVVGILAWMSDHHANPKDFPNPFYIGMFEGFWWSVVTMTTVGYGDRAPKGITARVLAVFWMMISIVFLALFTANATAILAISQADEDHTITLGKRVGVLNSKHFIEVELNIGSTVIEYASTLEWIQAATETRDVDRLIFPNYMDFLVFVKDEAYKAMLDDKFVLTNAIKYPFQIGMAVALDNDNMTTAQEYFLLCLRYTFPTLERQARKALDMSMIEFTENTQTKKLKTALDGDNLLLMSYYFFGIIAVLLLAGIAWDYWMHRQRMLHWHDPADPVNDPGNAGDHGEFDDVINGSQSGHSGAYSPNMELSATDHPGYGV